MRWRQYIMVGLLMGAIAACGKTELYHNLSEEDANEILVVLQQNGVDTKKVKEVVQNEVTWTIQVSPSQLGQARELLISHNLPRRKELGLSGVYKDKGFIPTPDEQKARFLLAQKGEIINSLLKIPEVVDADVVLNLPSPKEYETAETKQRASASVVVKLRSPSAGGGSLTEANFQQFVANSIENLDPRDVAVIITYATNDNTLVGRKDTLVLPSISGKSETPVSTPEVAPSTDVKVAGLSVSAASAPKVRLYIAIGLGVGILLALALIVVVVRSNRMKQEMGGENPSSQNRLLPPGN